MRLLFTAFQYPMNDTRGFISNQTKKVLVEIPVRMHWIYKNPKALASLMKGIEDAKAGRLKIAVRLLNMQNVLLMD